MFEIKFIDLCSGVIECLGDFSRKVSLLSQRLTWRHKTVEVNRWTTSELLNGVNSWDNLQTHYSCINCFKDTAQKNGVNLDGISSILLLVTYEILLIVLKISMNHLVITFRFELEEFGTVQWFHRVFLLFFVSIKRR